MSLLDFYECGTATHNPGTYCLISTAVQTCGTATGHSFKNTRHGLNWIFWWCSTPNTMPGLNAWRL